MTTLVIQQHASSAYTGRTVVNAAKASLTVAFAFDFNSPGEVLTKSSAGNDYIAVDLKKFCISAHAGEIVDFFLANKQVPRTINIAGNAIRKIEQNGWTQHQLNRAVYEVLRMVHQTLGIESLRSGGQTGADIAGAAVGCRLNIPTEVLMPYGFRQRNEMDRDEYLTEDLIRQQIVGYAALL